MHLSIFPHLVNTQYAISYHIKRVVPYYWLPIDLLLALDDSASPNLDRRESQTTPPTELKTSDRNSLLKYAGLPLNIFGRVSLCLATWCPC